MAITQFHQCHPEPFAVILRERSDRRILLRVNSAKGLCAKILRFAQNDIYGYSQLRDYLNGLAQKDDVCTQNNPFVGLSTLGRLGKVESARSITGAEGIFGSLIRGQGLG